MKKDMPQKGFLIVELITALAILAIVAVPIVSLQVRNMTYGKQMYCKYVVRQMLIDRIEILKAGAWEKYGICNNKSVNFIGEASENIPLGKLLLSIETFEDSKNVIKITLRWEPEHSLKLRGIVKETLVYAPHYGKRQANHD